MVGRQKPKQTKSSMYGTSIPTDSTDNTTVSTVQERITREEILDTLLNTPYGLTPEDIATRTNTQPDAVTRHLDALTTATIATQTEDGAYTASSDALPLEDLVDTGHATEVFLLEARDKEYREWFGVDNPYDATQPATADVETAVAALDQWFGVRKRIHQLNDHPN